MAQKIDVDMNRLKVIFVLLFLVLIPLVTRAQSWAGSNTIPDAEKERRRDSIIHARMQEEVDFVLNHIDSVYLCGRRGMSDEEWEKNVAIVREKVAQCNSEGFSYYYALRYLGLLLNDSHLAFPDGGNFSRGGIFQKTDTLCPLWVRTWNDGSVYCVRDYDRKIPEKAQIISVNGHSAKEIALLNRALCNAEEMNSMALMNSWHEPDPRVWMNFRNFLFMEGINAPYEVAYIAQGSTTVDTALLSGHQRGELFKEFKRSGDKARAKREMGKKGRKVSYQQVDENTGVLTINSFWGRNWIELLVFGQDWTFPRQLNRSMRQVKRDNVENLIIDLRKNGGGMTANEFKMLAYLTDQPIDMSEVARITDDNRKIQKIVISNGLKTFVKRDNIKQLRALIDSVPSGTLLRTDSLFSLQIKPKQPRNKFDGNVYVLTGASTYSAAQEFTQFFKLSGRGKTAGEPCGGYYIITSGNADMYGLPYFSNWINFNIPNSVRKIFYETGKYDYEPVDIPIEQSFEEWFTGEDKTLQELIEQIDRNDDDKVL